ncbi:MAG: hypothetical protein AAFR21_17625 [Pseudomonadota bacterium]
METSAIGEKLAASGRGLGSIGLIAGLVTFASVLGLGWASAQSTIPVALAPSLVSSLTPSLAVGVSAFFVSWALMAERDFALRPTLIALPIAGVSAAMFYWGSGQASSFMTLWLVLAIGALVALAATVGKTLLQFGRPVSATAMFYHSVNLPGVIILASLMAGLGCVLGIASGQIAMSFSPKLADKVIKAPFLLEAMVAGLGVSAIGMSRGSTQVLSAFRYGFITLGRLAMPVFASATLIILIMALTGKAGAFTSPAMLYLGLAFVGICLVQLAIQNGQAQAPALWLRASTDIAIATLPILALLAIAALMTRISVYGLTPERIFGFAAAGGALVFGLAGLVGLFGEARGRQESWLAPVAGLTPLAASLAVLLLVGAMSPPAAPLTRSAISQQKLLATGKISAMKFDYGYLATDLGPAGQAALGRLADIEQYPDAAIIRTRAQAILNQQAELITDEKLDTPSTVSGLESDDLEPSGIFDLPLNPSQSTEVADEDRDE